jgi:hypothetical protein
MHPERLRNVSIPPEILEQLAAHKTFLRSRSAAELLPIVAWHETGHVAMRNTLLANLCLATSSP